MDMRSSRESDDWNLESRRSFSTSSSASASNYLNTIPAGKIPKALVDKRYTELISNVRVGDEYDHKALVSRVARVDEELNNIKNGIRNQNMYADRFGMKHETAPDRNFDKDSRSYTNSPKISRKESGDDADEKIHYVPETVGKLDMDNDKIVITALKTLQQKIRQLEIAHEEKRKEVNELKMQLERQRLEHEHQQRLMVASAQEKYAAQRLAYERLVADRASDDVKLEKLEERKVKLQKDVEHLKARVQEIEAERFEAERKIESAKSELDNFKKDYETMKVQNSQTILTLAKQKDSQVRVIEDLHYKLSEMQSAVSIERTHRESAEQRLDAMKKDKEQKDAFLTEVLKINEALVNKLGVGRDEVRVSAQEQIVPKANIAKKPIAGVSRESNVHRNIPLNKAALANVNASKQTTIKKRTKDAPFVPTGQKLGGSYNVVAAVNGALRTARHQDPSLPSKEVRENLKIRATKAVNEVPRMFDDSTRKNSRGKTEYPKGQFKPTSQFKMNVLQDCDSDGSEIYS